MSHPQKTRRTGRATALRTTTTPCPPALETGHARSAHVSPRVRGKRELRERDERIGWQDSYIAKQNDLVERVQCHQGRKQMLNVTLMTANTALRKTLSGPARQTVDQEVKAADEHAAEEPTSASSSASNADQLQQLRLERDRAILERDEK
ncbi:hypothetical protein PG993_009838 [Apiospora rasikravindrae]|uniref:Uncharacterized protein n=1 Tax=Apiospora rasikravindrae TaxID=990691 RepID=A0ABR1SKI9_9PEZI